MRNSTIHIYEENINLFWGLLGLISITAGAYLLADAFFGGSWRWIGFQQISSLGLFAVGFYAIVKLTEPLYRFVLFMEGDILHIEIWEGSDTKHGTKKIALGVITELKIMWHTPPKENEALFDFSTNYHLLYRNHQEEVYQDLITLNDQSFTLKLKDIQKVIRFIKKHNGQIGVNDNQLMYRN